MPSPSCPEVESHDFWTSNLAFLSVQQEIVGECDPQSSPFVLCSQLFFEWSDQLAVQPPPVEHPKHDVEVLPKRLTVFRPSKKHFRFHRNRTSPLRKSSKHRLVCEMNKLAL